MTCKYCNKDFSKNKHFLIKPGICIDCAYIKAHIVNMSLEFVILFLHRLDLILYIENENSTEYKFNSLEKGKYVKVKVVDDIVKEFISVI